eukprot:759771-Hanusia_phi.AAC.1
MALPGRTVAPCVDGRPSRPVGQLSIAQSSCSAAASGTVPPSGTPWPQHTRSGAPQELPARQAAPTTGGVGPVHRTVRVPPGR